MSSLIQASDGNFYGVTNLGGSSGEGSIYMVTADGALTILYSFTGQSSDGGEPAAGLVQATDGKLYGTTTIGGANDIGTVFNISLQGTLTTLHSFDPSVDGNTPYSALALNSDGKLYGTLAQGAYNSSSGLYAGGTIFSISTTGVYVDVVSFPANGSKGFSPSARLIQASDGALYGTTSAGGANNQGTLFSYTSGGGLTALYSFTLADGSPLYGLVQSGSALFGTTFPDPDGYGEVFSLSLPAHVFNIVFPFTGDSDGGLPATALLPAGNGAIYGTTQSAGAAGTGTLFEIGASGSLSTLYNFPAGSINTYIDAALLQGSDGNFYDTVLFDSTVGLDSSQLDGAGTLLQFASSPAISPPITLTPSSSSVLVNESVTLSWNAVASSLSAQQCFASTGPGSPATSWIGPQPFTGSQSVTLPSLGSYVFALTCGGNVTASATVTAVSSVTATAQLSGPSTVPQDQHATLIATILPSGSGSPTPTGSVTFVADGIYALATIPLTAGAAHLTASSAGVPLGTYSLTAQYSGDSIYSSVTSPALKVTVTSPLVATTTSLSASPNPATSGQTIALTATVQLASGSSVPTGTVQFLYNSIVIGSARLSAGTATLRASTAGVAAGSYPIVATYLGDSSCKSSTSTHLTIQITN